MIGDNLRKIMADKKISAKWLADEVGVSQTHLSYVINNKRNLSFELAEKITNVLNIPLSELVQNNELDDTQSKENAIPVLDDPQVRALARRSLEKNPQKEKMLKKLIQSMLEED